MRFTKPLNFEYEAGQYVYLQTIEQWSRAYSLANSPEKSFLEFHIRNKKGSSVQQLFTACAQNETIQISSALGTCKASTLLTSTLGMIASGTGFSPCKALLEANARQAHPINLYYYGFVKTAEEAYATAWLECARQKWSWFHYHVEIQSISSQKLSYREWFEEFGVQRLYVSGSTRLLQDVKEWTVQKKYSVYSDE